MASCCDVEPGAQPPPKVCPECGRPGRAIERITVKAMLRPAALIRLADPEHRFCPTASCPVVYYGHGESFRREDVIVPVFQKEPPGSRTVCYCFGVTEDDLRSELEKTGRSIATDEITALVKAERCACEVKNPQGTCCLGNVAVAVRALSGA